MNSTSVRSIKEENLNAPATKRQLWALFCATKKDYRNENLTRAQAAELLSKANENRGVVVPKKKSSLEEDMIAFFKEHILDSVVASLKEAIGMESLVVEDTTMMKGTGPDNTARSYKFRGFGCSISYLTYDKRSKKAAVIEELWRKHRFSTFEQMVINQFPKKLVNQLAAEGTPIGALYCQDFDVNSTMFHGIVRFMKEQGVKKVDYVTRLD